MNSPQDRLPRIWLLSWMAVRNDRPSMTMAATSTAMGTHHHWLSSSWFGFPACTSSYLWNASYRANRPPTLNSTMDTMKA